MLHRVASRKMITILNTTRGANSSNDMLIFRQNVEINWRIFFMRIFLFFGDMYCSWGVDQLTSRHRSDSETIPNEMSIFIDYIGILKQ